MSVRSIRRTFGRAGDFYLHAELVLLRKLTAWLEDANPALEVALAASMFDETGKNEIRK